MKEKLLAWVESWEKKGYSKGIPDEACPYLEAAGLAPSWRRVCLAIMKNDVQLQTLGFSRQACNSYINLKRIELEAKGKKVNPIQGRLF